MIKNPKDNLEGFELVGVLGSRHATPGEQSMKNNEWIAFLGWTPHPVMAP